jgi:ubiquinone/menaquinone biosynthesis C-methylase UbiE
MAEHFNHSLMAKLDSPERKKILPPDVVLKKLAVLSGETVVDVGAGTGYFAMPATELVGPGGRVIAVDASREMADELGRRTAASGLANLEIVCSEEYAFGVASNTADLVLLATVLHEVDDKPRFLAEAKRVLKPGGRIGIVEWQAVETGRGPGLAERVAPAATGQLLRKTGFSSIALQDLNEFFYLATAIA